MSRRFVCKHANRTNGSWTNGQIAEWLMISLLRRLPGSSLSCLYKSQDGSLDVLGPAGTYAVDTFGDTLGSILFATVAIWAVVPVGIAWLRFTHGGDV